MAFLPDWRNFEEVKRTSTIFRFTHFWRMVEAHAPRSENQRVYPMRIHLVPICFKHCCGVNADQLKFRILYIMQLPPLQFLLEMGLG